MDWQIRIALIIAGLLLVGYIFFDFQRKRKIQKDNQKLHEKYTNINNDVDASGFDLNGVGSARKANNSDGEDSGNFAEISVNEAESLVNQSDSIPDRANKQAHECLIEEVFSLILQAPEGKKFLGREFLPLFLSQGLRHGDMGIFHLCKLVGNKPGNTLFSLANAISPGTFDIDNLERFETPAFALFMTSVRGEHGVFAYESMVKTAQFLRSELGGEILDKEKNVYTEQTYNSDLNLLRND